jgi:uncharacterized membrane protein YeaQ/YmgE (transglycosylase-associated protein family)
MNLEDTKLHMSNESLLIILGVGLVAGWLAGQIVQGTGFGIVGDLIIGIVGAFIGSWLLPQLGPVMPLRAPIPRDFKVAGRDADPCAAFSIGT